MDCKYTHRQVREQSVPAREYVVQVWICAMQGGCAGPRGGVLNSLDCTHLHVLSKTQAYALMSLYAPAGWHHGDSLIKDIM